MKVSPPVFRVFCLMLTICSVTYYCPFCLMLGSVGYLHTPWRRSTKQFTKQLSRCGGKSTCISCFLRLALCSPSAQSLNMVRFSWSWTRLATFTIREDAPQNRLRNGWAVVELSEPVFSHFLPYTHPLLSHFLWSILRVLRLDRIHLHSVKTLHKTVYETVEPL